MVEQVGFLIAGEGALEAVVLEGFAWGARDVMGFLGLPIFNGSAHNCEDLPLAGQVFWEMVESSWIGSQYL